MSLVTWRRLLHAGLVILVLQACEPAAPGTSRASTGAPEASAPGSLTAQEVLDAARFRRAFGLRDDEAWITAVAANPESKLGSDMYGVPLLPFEYEDLLRWMAGSETVVPVVAAYGAAYPEMWAGMFLDQAAGGRIVAQFTRDIEAHERRLVSLVPAGSMVDVRAVDWSLVRLREFSQRIKEQAAWFTSIGTELYAADIDEINNGVSVRFRSADESDGARIAEHFGSPEWLILKWMPSTWAGPTGDLIIEVVDRAGRPMEHMTCGLAPVGVVLPESAAAYSTRADGRCLPRGIPAVTYQVEIGAPTGDDDTVVASGRVIVAPEDSTLIRLVARSP